MSNKTSSAVQSKMIVENMQAATQKPSINKAYLAGQNTANRIYIIDYILISLVLVSLLLTIIAQVYIAWNG